MYLFSVISGLFLKKYTNVAGLFCVSTSIKNATTQKTSFFLNVMQLGFIAL